MINSDLVRGDRVVLSINTRWNYDYPSNPAGIKGRVTNPRFVDYSGYLCVEVRWDNGEFNTYKLDDNDLIKVAP
jgi:hypothetical protein